MREEDLMVMAQANPQQKILVLQFKNCSEQELEQLKKAQKLFFLAIEYDWSDLLEAMISLGYQVNLLGEGEVSPLHFAAKLGRVELYKILLQSGAKRFCRDFQGRTPLHYCCGSEVIELAPAQRQPLEDMLAFLLGGGYHINEGDINGNTPLHFALRSNFPGAARILLDKGADLLKINDNEVTPLHENWMEEQALQVLQEAHFNADERDSLGNNWLHRVCELDSDNISPHVAILLIMAGADIDAQNNLGDTPLHICTRNKRRDYAALILERNPQLELANKLGRRALADAVESGAEELMEDLLIEGALANACDNRGQSALHLAAQYDQPKSIILLQRYEADMNLQDALGRSALHLAVRCNHQQCLRILMEKGAEPDLGEKRTGRTPLELACSSGNTFLAETLLNRGADYRRKDSLGRTALHRACVSAAVDTLDLLIAIGAPVDEFDLSGCLPLHLVCSSAASHGARLHCLQMLLEYGADVNACDAESKVTALHLAAANGSTLIVKELIAAGADLDCKDINEITPRRLLENFKEQKAQIIFPVTRTCPLCHSGL